MGSPPTKKNSTFRLETAEKRLGLTSYMSYNNAEGRGSPWPMALHHYSSYSSLGPAVSQPFLAKGG